MTDLPVGTELLSSMCRSMIRIRRAEERIGELVENGEVGCPCHLCIGQEAIPVGLCAALEQTDTVWGGHRSHGHYLAKGGDLTGLFAEVFGKATGCSAGRGGSMHLFAPEVGILGTVPLVAATIPLAVGAALAARLQGTGSVSVSFFGDGAVEEGHFHESMNLAALHRLPVLFVCENNLYASHMALLERRAADNIVAAAAAHGLAGVVLDGNDPAEVYQVAAQSVARARAGEGPTLIECRTYRWRGHVGPSWNLDVGVRRKDELNDWLPRDPIARAAAALTAAGVAKSVIDGYEREVAAEIDTAVAKARAATCPLPADLVEHVYAAPSKGHRS